MMMLDRLFATYAHKSWQGKKPTAKDRDLIHLLASGASFDRLAETGHPLVRSFLEDVHEHLVATGVQGASQSQQKLHRTVSRAAVRFFGATRKHVQMAIFWRPTKAPLGTTFAVRPDLLGGVRIFTTGAVHDASWRGTIERLLRRTR